MRLHARSSVLLAALLLVGLPALAAAEPQPIAKPDRIAPIQPAKPARSTTPPASPAPAPPPPASTAPPASPPPPPQASPPPPPSTVTSHRAAPPAVVVINTEGGRDQSGIAVPAPPPPEPTPLGLVAAGERVSSPATSTPAWKLALLALLAAGEAFLVVRLVRNRQGGELSPAQ
jgi:hypothetical protein